jgi:hypothetical protein
VDEALMEQAVVVPGADPSRSGSNRPVRLVEQAFEDIDGCSTREPDVFLNERDRLP